MVFSTSEKKLMAIFPSRLFPAPIRPRLCAARHQRGGRRRRVGAAVLAIFHQYGEGDALAGRIGREPDEPGVRRRVGQLGRAGLARDRHAARRPRCRPVPCGHHFAHEFGQGGGQIRARSRPAARCVRSLVSSAIQRPCGICAAVGDGRRHARHLERRRHHLPLPVRRLRQRLAQLLRR